MKLRKPEMQTAVRNMTGMNTNSLLHYHATIRT